MNQNQFHVTFQSHVFPSQLRKKYKLMLIPRIFIVTEISRKMYEQTRDIRKELRKDLHHPTNRRFQKNLPNYSII